MSIRRSWPGSLFERMPASPSQVPPAVLAYANPSEWPPAVFGWANPSQFPGSSKGTVYTLFGQEATGTTVADDFGQYTFGMEFTLSANARLTGIWWDSPASSTALPDGCAIYVAVADTQVPGTLNASPTWSGAAGSGWVKCTYPGTVTLNSGTNYKVVVHVTGAEFKYGATSHYWDTGAGSGGITNGIITGLNNASSDGGQDSFVVGATLGYPNTSFNAANYWVDVEVTSP